MKLFYSETSPFARKCRMALKVTNLADKTEFVSTNFESPELRQANPLGKIPAFMDGETSLFDSALICEYIDHKYVENGGASLFKKRTGHYFETQLTHTRANGILDAAVSTVMERRRETEHSEYWLGRWKQAIETALKQIDVKQIGSADDIHIGTITTAAALGYLDFRLDDYNWRQWHSELADWLKNIESQSWFSETRPPE